MFSLVLIKFEYKNIPDTNIDQKYLYNLSHSETLHNFLGFKWNKLNKIYSEYIFKR